MKKSLLHILVVLAIGLLGVLQMNAQATLSVQGNIIQNFTGAAIDNGTYDITFKLYTTDAGGTPIWSETQSVNMVGGVYSVVLGAVNPLNVPFDQTYYMGLTLPGAPEHTPRTQLTAAPYALSMLGEDNKFPSTGMVQMGSVATGTDITTATSYTVGANDHVIYLDHTANQNVTLPAATAANAGRQLMLVNKEAVAKTLTSSNYVDVITGTTSTTVPANSVIELQSDGSVWRQTGGYVKPTTTKAFVRCTTNAMTGLPTMPSGILAWHTVSYTELSDAQSCFNNNTFTAPRTGIYRFSGVIRVVGDFNNVLYDLSLRTSDGTVVYYFYHQPETTGGINFSFDVSMTAGQSTTISFSRGTIASQTSILAGGNLTITEN